MDALHTVIGRCRRSMLGRRYSSQPQTPELHVHRPLTAVTSWPAGRLSTATIAAQSLSYVDAETVQPAQPEHAGITPLSRPWPSNSLPARRAHSNAPAAPADCQCYSERRASEPGRASAARTVPSSSASPAATSTAQGGRSEASRRAAEPPRTIATLPQGVS